MSEVKVYNRGKAMCAGVPPLRFKEISIEEANKVCGMYKQLSIVSDSKEVKALKEENELLKLEIEELKRKKRKRK